MLIPLSIIATGLELVVEIFRAFNSLPDDLRAEIVRDMLRDKKVRDEWWAKVTEWFSGIFKQVDITK